MHVNTMEGVCVCVCVNKVNFWLSLASKCLCKITHINKNLKVTSLVRAEELTCGASKME